MRKHIWCGQEGVVKISHLTPAFKWPDLDRVEITYILVGRSTPNSCLGRS